MARLPERYNVSTILDRQVEAGRGERTAVVSGEQILSYRQLLDRVCSMGRALQRLGLRPEERVLLLLDDSPAFPTAFFGAMRTGSVAVPVNPLYRVEDYRYFLEDSEARAVVVEAAYLDKLRQALEGLSETVRVIVHRGSAGATAELRPGELDLEALLAEHQGELPPARTHRDDMAFWLYSSGSTGRPKGVVHLHHDIPYTCETYGMQVLQVQDTDLCFSTSKCFHAYGLGNSISFPYWAGAASLLYPGRPTPEAVFAAIERYRPTLFFCVPTLYNALLNDPSAERRDLSSIRLCVSAGEALPAEIWQRWKRTYGLTILDGIGSTEMLHIFVSNTLQDLKPGSSGRPVPGYQVKVVDEDGRPVGLGGAGELYVSGDSAAAFYWRQHEKTKSTILGEWVRTGDRYRVDEEGFFWHEGRMDDMIKVGGLWVSPVDMESVLLTHPAVLEAAVVGVSQQGLARIKAYVVPRRGHEPSEALAQELQAWCKDRLQRYQYPHLVEFVAELPKTVTGKIQRFKLREAG